jgi:hypothetical protein
MKTYIINLVVDTKNTDIYDKVALNKFPIIVKCKTESELKEMLSQELAQKFIQEHIKSQRVFDSAEWYIRSVYEDSVREIVWKVSEIPVNTL